LYLSTLKWALIASPFLFIISIIGFDLILYNNPVIDLINRLLSNALIVGFFTGIYTLALKKAPKNLELTSFINRLIYVVIIFFYFHLIWMIFNYLNSTSRVLSLPHFGWLPWLLTYTIPIIIKPKTDK